ncbi:hypothetical protein E2562_000926 [Oryza meyeriana var. granulata]|uniref:Glycosyltransferase 2-like domain-containing protein n=1 Tax=Oryza meyeriana var. granulata TaxID=110450 RepID=A0A6G1CYE5_9ORYZ|nr:hypothetical protein E2562_000926 [Oryza meyeriana var. granulata]
MASPASVAGASYDNGNSSFIDPLLVSRTSIGAERKAAAGTKRKYWAAADKRERRATNECSGEDGRPLLFRSYKVKDALLHPYRALIFARLIAVLLFFGWRIQHNNSDIMWFWTMSVIADYPVDRSACYLSDDSGALILYEALVETTKFATLWVPFCRKHCIEPRAPESYFELEAPSYTRSAPEEFKNDYRIVHLEYDEFKVVLDHPIRGHNLSLKDSTDNNLNFGATDMCIPMLVYVSREKNPSYDHNKKAGALNAQLRVSAILSNAQFIINFDCDHYINNSQALRAAMCFMLDQREVSKALNQDQSATPPPPLNDTFVAEMEMVVSASYDKGTNWGKGVGYIYDIATEDIVTGFRIHGQGWRSMYCTMEHDAFCGTAPINLTERLHQIVRWSGGSLEMFFSHNNPLIGGRRLQPLQRVSYLNMTIYPVTSIFILLYAISPVMWLIPDEVYIQRPFTRIDKDTSPSSMKPPMGFGKTTLRLVYARSIVGRKI